MQAIAFAASSAPLAEEACARLSALYGNVAPERADVIVALGGDGFMLQTLHGYRDLDVPVYGMNRGTIGFLMNEYSEDDLRARLAEAEEEVINPLTMSAVTPWPSTKYRCCARGLRRQNYGSAWMAANVCQNW